MMAEFEKMPSKSMLDCPEELLEQIFSYLDATTLYQLSMTCKYIKNIVEERLNLWRCIDIREGHSSDAKTEFCINRLNKMTSCFCVRGNGEKYGNIPANFLSIIKPLKNLKVIALENQKFDGTKVCLKDFPECLEELSIKNSFVKRSKYFFKQSDQSMQKLRVLILDGCRWMHTTYFKWITKYERLEILSAANCLNSKFFVSYLWDKYKCKNLRIVDFRFSITIYCEDMQVTWKPLRAVYFQNVSSAEADYGIKIPYTIGRTYADIGVYSDFECDIDETFANYRYDIFGDDDIETLPVSYLYKDPYSECTCNYKERREPPGTKAKSSQSSSGINFLAFHKEAMDVDWNNASPDHSESEYAESSNENENDSDSDSSEPVGPKKLAIRRLSLRGFQDVTDESLNRIRSADLHLLDLTGTRVTQRGIEDFLVFNTNCRIVHDLYCVCKPASPF